MLMFLNENKVFFWLKGGMIYYTYAYAIPTFFFFILILLIPLG